MEGNLGALGKLAGNTLMEGTVGGTLLEYKAFMRLSKTNPEWLPNLIKSQKDQHERLAEIQRRKALYRGGRRKVQAQEQPPDGAAKKEAAGESSEGASGQEALMEERGK